MALLVSEPESDSRDNQSMASSVTRHAQNPKGDYKLLLCGIDSLDLGLYIDWGLHWDDMVEFFEASKEAAQNSKGSSDSTGDGRIFLHLPSGKPPNYRYHLQFPEYHFYFSKRNRITSSPNGYVSLNAEAIWKLGVDSLIEQIKMDVACLGGSIVLIVPSRCDLCADFKLPFALKQEDIELLKISRSNDQTWHTPGGCLETAYIGAPGAPLLLRIYDKGKEIIVKRKEWFTELWQEEDLKDIWRIEFQLRRPVLKQFGIDSMDDLINKIPGIWKYLTNEWFSLRLPDNQKQERRTIHPWWELVQGCAEKLGPAIETKREYRKEITNDSGVYLKFIGGFLPAYAASLQIKQTEDAIVHLARELKIYWTNRNFEEEVIRREIKMGKPGNFEGEINGQK